MAIFCLKPVDTQSTPWKFGVSDHSVVVLTATLWDDDPHDSVTPFAEAMASDPVLTVWAAVALARQKVLAREGATFRTIRELAEQVVPQLHHLLLNTFSCDDSQVSHLACEVPQSRSFSALRTLILAETARFLLASEPSSPSDDPIYLGVILASAAELVDDNPDVDAFTSSSFAIDLNATEKAATEEADRLIGRRQLPEKIGQLDERLLGMDELLGENWIEQRRQRLEQTVPAAETLLRKTLARLDRVRRIEEDFQKTLEQEKLEAMAEFAAGAGHEINNPIAVIAGRAQLMLQDETDPERARSLALINAQAKRVYEMIADMRLFARPPEPTFEKVDLVSLIDELFDEMAEVAEAQAMTLRRLGVRRAIIIDADPTQLTVMLRAMIQNSFEAIGTGGTIEIEPSEVDESTVMICVSDDGPGITDEVRRHLFDPYYSGRQAGRGLGLGLSKVWRIVVTNHGGTIHVDSQPGDGTVFTIRLQRKRR